jgi:succinyl-CoA synthetase alpha subunit
LTAWISVDVNARRDEDLSILVDKDTRLLVQGITGREGAFHTEQMVQYGTNVVAGVTPGRGGNSVAGVPVFDTVHEAVEASGANTSIVYVPAPFAPDAVYEAAANGIELIVCITENIPTLDTLRMVHYVRSQGARLIGPNCPGVITPGVAKVGIMPGAIHTPGPLGLVSRSGTLTYEAVATLTAAEIGQSTVVGIGGDPIVGTSFREVLELFENDPETRCIVLIGEIGGTAEEEAAEYVQEMSKPVVAFIAGRTAPPGRRMGHAGAIISGAGGSAQEKVDVLEQAGAHIATSSAEIADLVDVAMASG